MISTVYSGFDEYYDSPYEANELTRASIADSVHECGMRDWHECEPARVVVVVMIIMMRMKLIKDFCFPIWFDDQFKI